MRSQPEAYHQLDFRALLTGCCYWRHWIFHLIDNRFAAWTGTNSDRVVYLCPRPEAVL